MKDEIKEIFNIEELFDEWKRFLSWCYENNDKTVEIHRDKLKWTMDYITNLQEENDFIKKDRNKLLKDYAHLTILLEDYKSRIEKIVEYIKHAQNYGTIAQIMPHLKPYVNGDDLLNLLNGDEDE